MPVRFRSLPLTFNENFNMTTATPQSVFTPKHKFKVVDSGGRVSFEWVDESGQWRHRNPQGKEYLGIRAFPAKGRFYWSGLFDRSGREIYEADLVVS